MGWKELKSSYPPFPTPSLQGDFLAVLVPNTLLCQPNSSPFSPGTAHKAFESLRLEERFEMLCRSYLRHIYRISVTLDLQN